MPAGAKKKTREREKGRRRITRAPVTKIQRVPVPPLNHLGGLVSQAGAAAGGGGASRPEEGTLTFVKGTAVADRVHAI